MAEQEEQVKIEIYNLWPGARKKRTVYCWPAGDEKVLDRYDKIPKEVAFIVVHSHGRYFIHPTDEADGWDKRIPIHPRDNRYERMARAIAEHVQSSDETIVVAEI